MSRCKLQISDSNGVTTWIAHNAVVKMTKEADGCYYVYLVTGEKYLITHREASDLENCWFDYGC